MKQIQNIKQLIKLNHCLTQYKSIYNQQKQQIQKYYLQFHNNLIKLEIIFTVLSKNHHSDKIKNSVSKMPTLSMNPYQNKYQQLNIIGQGKFGIVYKVKSLSDNKQYVAKHMSLDNIQESVAKKQIQIIQTLRHPYVVQYIQSFKSQSDFIIIMEYCQEKDLAHHIELMKKKNKHFNENLVITWLFQLVLGLQYIHSKKVLHRDIKPENIFIDENLNVKIGDFGVSRLLNSTQQCCNTTAGTPCYLAPEICEQQKYTSKADIWSLGCVIYEMCSLEKPFKGGIFKIFDQIKSGKIQQIPSIYSIQLKNLVLKLMTRDQSKRPSTVQVLKDPVLVDLMIKNSSSMSLKKQYNKNIEKEKSNLTESFIDKQTNLVKDQLKLFQEQVKIKMEGLKKKQFKKNQIDQQYSELKAKMAQIQIAIGKAFQELRKKSARNNQSSTNSNSSVKKYQIDLKNSSVLTDSSDMTIIESVQIGNDFQSNKLKNKSTIAQKSTIDQGKQQKKVRFKDYNIESTQSEVMSNSSNFSNTYKSINIKSKYQNNSKLQESQSMDQTLQSEYQKTIREATLAKDTLTKLDFLQKTLSQNPDALFNDSLLNFTLTMSRDQSSKDLKFGKGNKQKSSNNIEDSINFDLTKRDPAPEITPFRKKTQDQLQKYYQEEFQAYEDDFENQQNQQNQQNQSNVNASSAIYSSKQRRRNELNTIISFYQQTLQDFDNEDFTQPQSPTRKVKNKYPLLMSEIKQQPGESGSLISKANNSTSNNSSSRF